MSILVGAQRSALRVLVLEDSEADAELIVDMLADELPGAAVDCARTLADALEALAEPRDVVLADLGLPDAEGLQVLRALRERRAELTVVLLTGRNDEQLALDAIAAGAEDYLVKGSHDARTLARAVQHAVQRARAVADSHRYERLALSLLDAMENPTCAVGKDGRILAVNRAWRRFAVENGGDLTTCGVGVDYPGTCERVRGPMAGAAQDVAGGIRAVLDGTRARYEHDYPCHSPTTERWFSLRATPLPDGAGAVLTHVDISEAKRAAKELSYQAMHDALTDLPNRLLLTDRLQQALAHADRSGRHVAVAFLDLDHFKRVNDSLGHATGDELLVAVSRRLQEVVRPGDTLARFSGDEFVVVWHDLAEPSEADLLSQRLAEAFAEPFLLGTAQLTISASTGIAVGRPPMTADELLLSADAAMYDAKNHGRGRARLFTRELHEVAVTRMRVEVELRGAAERDELVLHYQPVVDLRAGHVIGVEALLRWQHPQDGLLMPDAFIPVAEASGLIVPVGSWALEQACVQAAQWTGDRRLDVAVNLSVRQVGHPDVVGAVERALARSGLAPDRLLVEVTESAVLEDAEAAGVALRRIAELGPHIAIDDFGTGYSSLLYLKRYPIRALKIDRSFVAGLGQRTDDDAIVASVISLAHAVGAVCIAEGVETAEQLATLRALGCDLAQGYWFSRPVPAGELPAVVDDCERRLAGVRPAARQRIALEDGPLPTQLAARMRELHLSGASLHTVAAALNREGFLTPSGVRWHGTAVARHLAATLEQAGASS